MRLGWGLDYWCDPSIQLLDVSMMYDLVDVERIIFSGIVRKPASSVNGCAISWRVEVVFLTLNAQEKGVVVTLIVRQSPV